LLKSYLQVREQLHATQLAIATSRIEAEVTARAQAAAVTEKLEAIKSAMDAERQYQRLEAERAQAARAEHERQQLEEQRSNRVILWIAAGFGALALLAIAVGPLLQWRALNHLTQVVALRPPFSTPAQPALLTGEGSGISNQTVIVSNQRMHEMIERMERRIFELEHTAGHSSPMVPVASTSTFLSADSAARDRVE
jgi:hypothetical protein